MRLANRKSLLERNQSWLPMIHFECKMAYLVHVFLRLIFRGVYCLIQFDARCSAISFGQEKTNSILHSWSSELNHSGAEEKFKSYLPCPYLPWSLQRVSKYDCCCIFLSSPLQYQRNNDSESEHTLIWPEILIWVGWMAKCKSFPFARCGYNPFSGPKKVILG